MVGFEGNDSFWIINMRLLFAFEKEYIFEVIILISVITQNNFERNPQTKFISNMILTLDPSHAILFLFSNSDSSKYLFKVIILFSPHNHVSENLNFKL